MKFTEKQQEFYDEALAGKNIFLTGKAGTGKSFIVTEVLNALRKSGRKVAASLIGVAQSPVCGGDDGLPSELDGITFSKWRNESLKAYGNAIVPQVVYRIFRSIESNAPSSDAWGLVGIPDISENREQNEK